MSDYVRIQNDTGRALKDTLETDGTADDLSGATVVFTMWEENTSGTPKIDENEANVTVTDAANGQVEYDFASGDLDTVGEFLFEWEVTFSDGTIVTYRSLNGQPKELTVLEEGA